MIAGHFALTARFASLLLAISTATNALVLQHCYSIPVQGRAGLSQVVSAYKLSSAWQ